MLNHQPQITGGGQTRKRSTCFGMHSYAKNKKSGFSKEMLLNGLYWSFLSLGLLTRKGIRVDCILRSAAGWNIENVCVFNRLFSSSHGH